MEMSKFTSIISITSGVLIPLIIGILIPLYLNNRKENKNEKKKLNELINSFNNYIKVQSEKLEKDKIITEIKYEPLIKKFDQHDLLIIENKMKIKEHDIQIELILNKDKNEV